MKKFLILFSLATLFLNCHAQIFYKIEGNGAKSPSYIFGSHHLSPIDVVDKSGALTVFPEVEQVVGEIDLTMDPMTIALAVQPAMMAPADSTLSVFLKNEDINALNAQFQKWAPAPGMQLQMLDALKPMAVTTMMAAAMSQEVMPGFDPNQQLDAFFMKKAKEDGKKVLALETPKYQGEVLFNSIPLSLQAETMIEMLKNPEQSLESAKKLSDAYIARDLNAMAEVSKQEDEHPEFMEAVLYRRNADWMTKLPDIIKENPSFIVVGALHLAGPQGLIESLQNAGFNVTPIY